MKSTFAVMADEPRGRSVAAWPEWWMTMTVQLNRVRMDALMSRRYALMSVALFSSVLAYIFWNQGVEAVGANVAGLFVHLMPVFGSALAAEGIFAFFLESGFLAILLFGWDKVGRTR